MKKQFVQRLMLLAVVAMASITSFAQTGEATSLKPLGDVPISDYYMVRYHVTNANSSPGQIEFIGFASNVNSDETQMTEDFDGTLTIFNYISGSVSAWVSNIPANAFTSTTLNNDSPNKSNFAACAALTTKLSFEYDEEHALDPATIGSNAFGGLTALTQVINQTPSAKVVDIPKDAFASSTYKNATLKVPEGSVKAYQAATGWKRFKAVTDGTVLYGDVDGNGSINLLDYKALLAAVKAGSASVSALPAGADVDGNGRVNLLDYKLLLNKVKGVVF